MTEYQTVEYKQIWNDAYLKWICGFANAQGGMLVIGCNVAGELVVIAIASYSALPKSMEVRPLLIDQLQFIHHKSPDEQVRSVAEILANRLSNLRALGQ